VRSTSVLSGTRRCMKKKERENGSEELNPIIYITPSSRQETKQ
jgi:ribosomal protein L21E